MHRMLLIALALATVGAFLGGCALGSTTKSAKPTSMPTIAPSPTPGFSVDVTSLPTAAPRAHATPTATSFDIPSTPYIALFPDTGPPSTRVIEVVGGHLPKNTTVQLSWSSKGKSAVLNTSTYSDRHGEISTVFTLPDAAAGQYVMRASDAAGALASANYTIASLAYLTVSVTPGGSGDRVHVHGFKFVPGMRTMLVAYPTFKGSRQIVLGRIRASTDGMFIFDLSTRKLVPGEYSLAALSTGPLTTQLANTYFQVLA